MSSLTNQYLRDLGLMWVHQSDTGLQGEKFRYAWIKNKSDKIFGVIHDDDNEQFIFFHAEKACSYEIVKEGIVDTLERLRNCLTDMKMIRTSLIVGAMLLAGTISYSQKYEDFLQFAEKEKNVNHIEKTRENIVIYYNDGADLFVKQFNFKYNPHLKAVSIYIVIDIYNAFTTREKAIESYLKKGYVKKDATTYVNNESKLILTLMPPDESNMNKPTILTSFAYFFDTH